MNITEMRLECLKLALMLTSDRALTREELESEAQQCLNWITQDAPQEEKPISVNLSANMDSVALGGLIERAANQHKATIPARPAPLDPPTAENLEGRREFLASIRHTWMWRVEITHLGAVIFAHGEYLVHTEINHVQNTAIWVSRKNGVLFSVSENHREAMNACVEHQAKAKAQIVPEPTPEEVLRANGWIEDGNGYWQKGKVEVYYSAAGTWAIRPNARPVLPHKVWDKSETFPAWLAANVILLS